MLDHLILGVGDYDRSRAFYRAALAPLGYEVVLEIEGLSCGFGKADYYGAFVFDPDGNNVEAVCHVPE